MGPLVYNNAVAFVRIRDIDQNLDQDLHPLDSTRLHPDVYVRHNWAIKIAFDSLEREDPKSNAASMKALRDAMDNSYREVERLFNATKAEWVVKHGTPFYAQGWDPKVNVPSQMWRDNIEELDLEKFADMIEQKNEGKWHSHLEMIKWEFRLPYADIRMPMKHLAGDNLYHLITGETDQSLRPGKEVTGVVTQNLEFGSKVMVEGKIPGFIPLRSLSDQEVADPNDVVTPNQTITAIVIEVKKEHMSVNLSLRIEDFRKTPSSWQRPLTMSEPDLCFDHGASKRIEDENTARREQHIEALQLSLLSKGEASQQRKGRVTKRACLHPAFTNDKSEVERRIKEGGAGMVGEAIIRPSTKNPDVLAVHWVFRNGHEKVFEVNESEKETDASIGSKLTVKGETYGSIDELLGRHIAPMNDLVEEAINHRKFMDATVDEVDRALVKQKQTNPGSIPYAFCWMNGHPGYLSLRCAIKNTGSVQGQPVGIKPKGFFWASKTYDSLDRLSNDFKKTPMRPKNEKKRSEVESTTEKPKPPTQNRWQGKPPPPPQPSVTAPPPQWNPAPPTQPPIHAPPPIHAAAGSVTMTDWRAPPQGPPPPNNWGRQPPPPFRQPPPPHLPPPPMQPPVPPNFGQPPAFDANPPQPSGQGRGRGRTLPAWMSN